MIIRSWQRRENDRINPFSEEKTYRKEVLCIQLAAASWAAACVCGLPDLHSFPVSTNIPTPGSSQQKAKTYIGGGQGEGGRGRRTAKEEHVASQQGVILGTRDGGVWAGI